MGNISAKKFCYTLSGKIVYGKGIGKLLGTPTANLKMRRTDNIPPAGVYITKILLDGKVHYGVTNIGACPTIDSGNAVSVETHIINFNEDVYGKEMEIQLFERIRGTQKFDNCSLLLEQIRSDCIAAGNYFGVKTAFSGLYMDIEKHRACIDGQELYLSKKEFDVLYMLYSSPDAVYTKEQLYTAVWREIPNGFCHAVENTVFQIRKKCRVLSKDHDYIKTIAGCGYKLNVV